MKMLFIILSVFLMTSCNRDSEKEQPYMDITVIRDLTDSHELEPDANIILGLYGLTENKSVSVNFRYHEITDKMLVPVVSLHLPDAPATKRMNKQNEPLFREKVILNFYNTIRIILDANNINSDSTILSHSECFRTIANELDLLAQSRSLSKILLVYSNLFENSGILSIYQPKTKNLLLEHTDKIADQFENLHLLPKNLKGMKVFFVFQPATREEDLLYLKMIEVYERLLLPRGAKVIIQANNGFKN